MSKLAIRGGTPVRPGTAWPAWPRFDADTETAVLGALRSRRWTISWAGDGTKARERQFAEAWAAYNGARYCVSVDHGSSALVVALEALDVGPGDEVIVPSMTWVAPVTSVLRVGALPVLADVDPQTGCLTPDTIKAALGPRTKAVVLVHLACTVADLDEICALAGATGLGLIEDCAQAHGARYGGRHVGTFGDVGAFSFQNGKVLAAGEGGAVIMSDERLYRRAQQLRADSRRYPDGDPTAGALELIEDGEVMGANYCMSELSAAILLDQLPRLDAQHARREKQAAALERGLADTGGFAAIPVPEQVELRSTYEYALRVLPGTFPNATAGQVTEALSAELGMAWYPADPPLQRSVMMRPWTKRRFAMLWTEEARGRALGRDFPGAEAYCASTLLFHHSALLGDTRDIDDILTALNKVRTHRDEL